jgi:Contractile injection system tube protein
MATSPDFPRSLEPKQIALPAALSRGALLALPDPDSKSSKATKKAGGALVYELLRFQYNPETVTRSRTGQWERKLDKKTSKSAQEKQADDASRGGAIKSKSEVISFKLVFDAAERIMAGQDPAPDPQSPGTGVMPELAVLERLALGPDQVPDPPKKDNEFALVTLNPTEVILVLGPRAFPGVITQMNIVEQRFNTNLVPTRAEIDIRFRVLEATSVSVNKDTQKAFQDLLAQRESLAKQATATGGSVQEAIQKALAQRPGGGR